MGGFKASRHQLLALAVVSVLNNSISKVSYCLRGGIGYEIIFNFVAAAAMFIYYCCASELTSRFPFPGGCFGFARCTVGFYPAFLIGCMEIFYYMEGLSIIALTIVEQICVGFPVLVKWKVAIVIGAYCLQYCLSLSKKLFYTTVTMLAVYGIFINVAFIVGSYPYLNFNKWAFQVDTNSDYWNNYETFVFPPIANDDVSYGNSTVPTPYSGRQQALFNPNPWLVLQLFGRCLSVYMQAEYANLAVDDAKNPRADIPFALLVAAGILFVFCTVNPILAASMEPGLETASQSPFPVLPGMLNIGNCLQGDNGAWYQMQYAGLAKVFNISQHQAVLLLAPIYFARMMATCFALGKLISAMAGSRLFPRFLAKKVGADESPVPALSLVAFLGLTAGSLFLRMDVGKRAALAAGGASLACMCGLFTYCIQLFGYMVMRMKLSRIQSVFRSPFGVMGGVLSFGAFLVGMVSNQLVSTPLRNLNSIVVVSVVALSTAYYCLYAKDVQTFSNAEREVLLLAHAEIKNANGK
jgi:amino acid transporter